ncbi:hypothetical protein HHK36_001577 [Tetracentron sinense]|uniref:Uncharacterized protein n=1 Tax=Tetracentron sinense TaxID=13715 RepID=A0A835A2Z9_TETSI|nr:hypothetical protein HHK36_001577 [Tetracentron sinense]
MTPKNQPTVHQASTADHGSSPSLEAMTEMLLQLQQSVAGFNQWLDNTRWMSWASNKEVFRTSEIDKEATVKELHSLVTDSLLSSMKFSYINCLAYEVNKKTLETDSPRRPSQETKSHNPVPIFVFVLLCLEMSIADERSVGVALIDSNKLAVFGRFIIGFFLGAVPWYVGAFIILCVQVDYREKPGFIACTIAVSSPYPLGILAVIAVTFGVTKGNHAW